MVSRSTVDNIILRKSFRKVKNVVPVPNLIEVQSKSFNDFVQLDYLPSERKVMGLEKALRDVFPIEHSDKLSLEYVSYELGNWACTCGLLTGIVNRYTWECSRCDKRDCSRLEDGQKCTGCDKKTARYIMCQSCHSRVGIKVPLSVQECRDGEETYAFPLKVKIQLITWDVDDNGVRNVHDIKEQNVYFADVPVMVDLYEQDGQYFVGNQGTFIINGVDRVVVSQLHRSPGAVFSKSKKNKDLRGRPYYLARIIPMRGSWIDFEFDTNDCLYVRIDKKKKVLVSTFLQAMGTARQDILPLFYASNLIYVHDKSLYKKVDQNLLGSRLEHTMLPEEHAAKFAGRRVTEAVLEELKKLKIDRLHIQDSALFSKVLRADLIDQQTGELLIEQGTTLNETHCAMIRQQYDAVVDLVDLQGYIFQPTMALTLMHDRCFSQEEALHDLHAKIWPGDSASLSEVKERLERQFFSNRYYDLTRVGRIRLNSKLGLNLPEEQTALTYEDILGTIRYIIALRERGIGELDDIDHLGNRRVRLVGELLSNQIYTGLARMERIAKERFRMQEVQSALMPQDFLNVKPLSAILREFFGSGQLSQFMDQTNPLAELAHKRRLSALGPGGVMKDRATYEVRDVHTSHYGRICPIETPEGQTIGLISSLATYAMVNDLGFIESAYRPVKDGKIIDEVIFLNAFEESSRFIAQADALDVTGTKLKEDRVLARHEGNFIDVDSKDIDCIDLSPQQLVSVAASLIPFLEHDDASRALMGANMQRQAVPLIRSQTPIVGTGMEAEVCKVSGAVVTAEFDGVVEYVSADKIIVRANEESFKTVDDWVDKGVKVYTLKKFNRSSYSTWIHQRPVVKVGDIVAKGDILTDGSSIEHGELALGTNIVVAFMPWNGYNYEDAIVVSRRLVADDVLTSVSIDEYVSDARDTKLGPEEITRDIPNVGEKALAHLDDYGIVKIGTRVVPGDILVGKVTLKGDVQYSPEEKLLRAIFGEKSREVKDTSLRVSPGVEGTVVDVKVFSRSGVRKDQRYKEEVAKKTEKLESDLTKQIKFLREMVAQKACQILDKAQAVPTVKKTLLEDGAFDKAKLQDLPLEELLTLKAKDKVVAQALAELDEAFNTKLRILHSIKEEKIANLKKGDDLASGVIKVVKVYIASKRTISVGDKIAGRHGNKGVISNIVPIEDMPYLDDGTSVDLVLNPLGVPSRMNVGQILETILGFAGKKLGENLKALIEEKSYNQVREFLIKQFGESLIDVFEQGHGKDGLLKLAERTVKEGVHFAIPIFQGANFQTEIQPLLQEVGLPQSGSFMLRDGRSGQYFDQPVTVGVIYIIKLNHMVDDKLHARSVGPYSLITQQPLGGKAQFGGQRFGEMEIWALEAYGASYTLQEMLTYKSDDVVGRHKVYESIVRSDEIPDPGLPEAFNVLVKELQSLGLQVDLFKTSKEELGE
ncbi:MAG: DNA-directed RNA polymerase subunit beta [Candidatus Chromulinivorax sp.]